MANYIKTLESIADERGDRLTQIHENIEWMRSHLLSSKFVGQSIDGERKDWISTADVLRFIEQLRAI